MAKKKKTPEIKLNSFDNISFDKEPDLDAAKSILEEKQEEIPEVVKTPPEPITPPTPVKEEPPKAVKQQRKKKEVKSLAKGTLPPANKKRTSFNIDATLHKALRDYCYYNEIEMVEYVFEKLVKSDLKKKGLYPPK